LTPFPLGVEVLTMKGLLVVAVGLAAIWMSVGCARCAPPGGADETKEDHFRSLRNEMVDRQLAGRDVTDPKVLAAMRKIERHKFVPPDLRDEAYVDSPLPIGEGQTISQPYIVGLMTQLLQLKGGEKVLEVGTGSGYQAAVLAEIAKEVYTIEIIEKLGKRADVLLKELGYKNVHVKIGDGYRGWPKHAPFDAIIVTAAPEHIPPPLIDQLKIGGRLVIPVGEWSQELIVVEKTKEGVQRHTSIPVQFVPMTGEAQRRR